MKVESTDSLSIPEKILQTLFLSLEGQTGFGEVIISQLKVLAEHDELAKADKVTAVLKTDAGGPDEAH
jgi:hypothetical protein